jgi:uncharacterized protein YoaH (UPF0181 family)
MNGSSTNSVLTAEIYDGHGFAGISTSDRIDLGHDKQTEGVIYHMADEKSMSQTYYEDVEALKATGVSNADAIRQVAEKYGKNANAVRGGIHQYKTNHLNGGSATTTPTRRRSPRRSTQTVDDYLANARQALEAARDLIDQEVNQAKAALEAAQARYDQAVASVKDRKADIEKKLKVLS